MRSHFVICDARTVYQDLLFLYAEVGQNMTSNH